MYEEVRRPEFSIWDERVDPRLVIHSRDAEDMECKRVREGVVAARAVETRWVEFCRVADTGIP